MPTSCSSWRCRSIEGLRSQRLASRGRWGILRTECARTGRERLLKLLGLVGVLEHQGVEVLLASDLELDVVGLLVLLDPRGYSGDAR